MSKSCSPSAVWRRITRRSGVGFNVTVPNWSSAKTADPKGESTGDEFATLEQCNLMAQGDRFQQFKSAISTIADNVAQGYANPAARARKRVP
jgi:hypothetical protein